MLSAFQTFGRLGAGARAVAAAWTPASLWPTGTEAGMWIDPSNLTSQWQDSTGTTPVATPGTVADSSNPVGLALDLRLGAPDTLGPELVVNGDFATGISDWEAGYLTPTLTWNSSEHRIVLTGLTFATVGQAFSVVAGKTYRVSANTYGSNAYFWAGLTLSGFAFSGFYQNGSWVFTADATGSVYVVLQNRGVDNVPVEFDNISVREVPGNHLLQATSTARPLGSARVNLLTYTEDFGNAVWGKSGVSITANTTETTDPIGGNTADKIISTTTSSAYTRLTVAQVANTTYTLSVYAKMGNQKWLLLVNNAAVTGTWNAWFNLEDGTLGTVPPGAAAEIAPVGDGWYRCSLEVITAASISNNLVDVRLTSADNSAAVGNGDYIYGWGAQLNSGINILPYQPILTDGSSYSPTGFPTYLKFDGTDDGMATASFAAGTLTSSMDCLIAVRRGAAGNAVCGLYESVSDANKVFGIAESGSGSGCVGSGAGTPTVWVDGAQLTGGTAVTRGTLHTALSAGDWHILELRGLDLSTWTAAGSGLYTSYVLNGAQGGILLFPSSTPTADRDAARTWLGAKVGLTL